MTILDELKQKPTVSREDIAKLLRSIGKPGEKQDEKVAAVKELGRRNGQGHGVEVTLESYGEW